MPYPNIPSRLEEMQCELQELVNLVREVERLSMTLIPASAQAAFEVKTRRKNELLARYRLS